MAYVWGRQGNIYSPSNDVFIAIKWLAGEFKSSQLRPNLTRIHLTWRGMSAFVLKRTDHRYDRGLISLPLILAVWFTVGSVFLVEFFPVFSSTVRQKSGKLKPQPFPDNIGHHYHRKSFIMGTNDLWCRRALNLILYTERKGNKCHYCNWRLFML